MSIITTLNRLRVTGLRRPDRTRHVHDAVRCGNADTICAAILARHLPGSHGTDAVAAAIGAHASAWGLIGMVDTVLGLDGGDELLTVSLLARAALTDRNTPSPADPRTLTPAA